jgi:multiple sugar transport system ATP-binding protein
MSGIGIDRIGKSFGTTRVLRDVSLDCAPGEFVSLVGPSGCGKSTLLRLIAGLDTPDTGAIRIAERDMTGLRAADRDVAMVFQNYALYPHFTVFQNIALPLTMRRLSTVERLALIGRLVPGTTARRAAIAGDVHRAASALGIDHLLDRRPAQLSGGQRQRVALGRAIVRDPAAFLMDEPLSNLDAALRHDMRRELVDLHRRVGVTTVYVTHDQAEAMTMSDRVAVMMDGAILQADTPARIYDDPVDLRVARFIGSPRINVLPGETDSRGLVTLAGVPVGLAIATGSQAVQVAIRPEHVDLAPGGLAATVTHLEFLGSDGLVYARTSGTDIVIRTAPERIDRLARGATVHLRPQTARAFVFDAAGRRLPAVPAPAEARVHVA